MPFNPPLPVKERILDLGPAGSGRPPTSSTSPDTSPYSNGFELLIGDSDFAMERMLTDYPELFPISGGIHPLYDWDDYFRFDKFAVANARPNDWICVDFMGSAWKAVQEEYVHRVFNK